MSEHAITKLKRLEGYRFKAEFDVEGIPDLIVDELEPIGENTGPNPTRLLSTAVGHCLSSSLLFCLSKAHVEVKNLETQVTAFTKRNEQGRLRIEQLQVQLHIEVAEEDKPRLPRCLSLFEDYCTVTQSVRQGIEVTVDVK